MKIKHIILWGVTLAISSLTAQNQQKAKFTADAWVITAKNHEFKNHLGKDALFLDQGKAKLKNSSFKTGVIEYDVSFEQARNFVGVHFHIKDELNYEEYYLRPHQSGNPDAMQYTPVINGNAGWQLYSGDGHWSPKTFNFGQWMHIKLIVSDHKADVFIDDMETPILHIKDFKLESTTGGLGFGTFLGAAYFANLEYREIENPELVSEMNYTIETEPGTIIDWKVSKAFSASKLADITYLEELQISVDTELKTDGQGVLNLSHISKVSDATNTVLAKIKITSDKNQLKQVDFGYSDKVTVFVNGKPVYHGDNSFKSRDYRYLGSIGFFDSVFIDLREGNNEVVFAVTEKMGGWGLTAKITD